jgi:hypothetical protein
MKLRLALEKLARSWGISLSDAVRFAAGKLLTEEGIDPYKEEK